MVKLKTLKWEDFAEFAIWSQNNYKSQRGRQKCIYQKRPQDNGKSQTEKNVLKTGDLKDRGRNPHSEHV